jgi:peptidoglycan/LPS O-acetylase OafA/YrhL
VGLLLAGMGEEVVYHFTVCRMDALVAGAAVAGLVRLPAVVTWLQGAILRITSWAVVLFVVGAVLTRGYGRVGFASQTVGYGIVSVLCAVVILAAVVSEAEPKGRFAEGLAWSPLRWLGKYSYGIYVFHHLIQGWPADRWLRSIVPSAPLIVIDVGYLIVISALSCMAAYLSYHLLEKWFLRMKHRFVPSPSIAGAVA